MWEGVLSSIIASIGVSLCTNCIDKRHYNEFHQKLTQITDSLFAKYADTSLDCDEFASFVKSTAFSEMLRHYFFSIGIGEKTDLYLNAFVDDIYKRCPHTKRYEVQEFVKSIEDVYTSFLGQEIKRIPALSSLYQLLLISQKQLLKKIQEDHGTLMQYFETIHNRSVQITDSDIHSYHQVCNREFGVVRFTGISGVENKGSQDINQFYVENSFSYFKPFDIAHIYDKETDEPVFGLKQFFDGGNKVVLIGGAGLGKSTSLNYLFCNYEKLYHCFALKLKINLKDYASDISDKHHDILWCLATEFSKHIPRNKLTFENVSALLAEYLLKGKCLVIFDALDEIPVQASRNKVRDEISTFCDVYYSNRFIISTREVGYLRNRFDKDFVHIRINEFNMSQIKQYSKNWLKINHEGKEFDKFWKRFELELKRAKCQNLIKNPIILILALVIFDVQNSLPNRRVEFYKKCIDTFLIAREDRKNAFTQTDSFKNILGDNSVVPKIAHYKFEKINEDMGYHFTMEELKEAIMQAIAVPNRRQWHEPVTLFAKYLIDRTELIRETDEDILDFAHKTFYEYFLAVYYAQEFETKDLIELLDDWIGDSNNDEMARLIIEVIIEKNDAKQHKAVIEYLFARFNDDPTKEYVFSIISELYEHNILQAKYHDEYYNSILFHSDLVFCRVAIRDALDEKDAVIRYNERRVAELFLENIEQNPSTFYSMIASLKYLNQKFKNDLMNLSNDLRYEKIIRLFASVPPLSSKSSVRIREQRALFEYFITESDRTFLYSPEIYLSLISSALERDAADISKFFDFQFKANVMYRRFLSPRVLFQLFEQSFNSAEKMLLLLISIIHCACGDSDTDFLVRYTFRNYHFEKDEIDEVNVSYVQQRAFTIWENLFERPNFGIWIDWLTAQGLYLNQHEKLYAKLFSEYTACAGDDRKRLQREIREWRKNNKQSI